MTNPVSGPLRGSSVNSADYWLDRADVIREAAKTAQDARTRTHLIGSAKGYAEIARYLAAQQGAAPKTG